jgi:hypothetical protein
MSRIRCALLTAAVAAMIAPLPALAGATANGSSSPSQAEQLRQIEQERLQALVDADATAAGSLMASDFELINPIGDVLSRDDLLGGVRSGAIDFLSDELTSEIRVRLHADTAVLRYGHMIDIRVTGVGHLTHPAWTTEMYERRNGRWQIVWEQTGAIGPLPLPS